MTLYLKIVIGETHYLIPAAQVRDVAPAEALQDALPLDCRLLFGALTDRKGHRLTVETETGDPAGLVVDAIHGVVEFEDDSFRPLPPIGRFGAAIDAVSVPEGDEKPALRLNVGALLDEVGPAERVD